MRSFVQSAIASEVVLSLVPDNYTYVYNNYVTILLIEPRDARQLILFQLD